ncbi:MAG: hypothetical protein AB8G16_04350 [Gammaproteobacteria bacterium]
MKRAIVLCCGVLGACTPPPEPINGDITGAWHGQRWEGAARVQWLSRIADDGEIDIRFMTCFNGDVVRAEHQFGYATLTDGTFRIELDRIEHPNPDSGEVDEVVGFDHDYAMTELNAERMRYYSVENGERYEALNVSLDFEPQCAPASLNVRTAPGARRTQDAWITRMAQSPDEASEETEQDAGEP